MRVTRVPSRCLSSLREPLATRPAAQAAPSLPAGVQRSTTANGVDVVTVDRNSPHSAAVFSFRAGSRFESLETSGAAAHLSKMIWQANKSGKTTVAVTRDLLLSTSAQFSSSSREALSFGAEFVRDNTLSVTEQLGFIAQPLIRGWEVEDTRFLVEEEGADEVTFSLDAAHWTAFRGQALGKSPIPLELSTSAASLRQFSDAFITRANAVVVGVGVEHASFAAAAERVLAGLPAGRKAESPAARYVGGETHTESPEQPTVVLGFESAAFGSSGFFAAGVLHQVLGRTPDRFLTKARPGHGLASRLNRKLGGQGAVIFADSFATGYSDTGLFGVVFKTLSGDENAVTQAVVAELLALAEKPLDAAELEGAKRRLKYAILASSERADARASFYAQQALTTGKVLDRAAFAGQVDGLSAADVQAAAKRMLSSKATLVSEGNSCNIQTPIRGLH